MSWSFYNATTGEFLPRLFSGSSKLLEQNTPAGHVAIEGQFDPLSQRVDVETGEVVDYQPPQPDDDHEWREKVVEGRPRWVKKREIVAREARAATAQADIDALERKQLRPMRELALDPSNAPARQRVAEIEAEIVAKRVDLPADRRD